MSESQPEAIQVNELELASLEAKLGSLEAELKEANAKALRLQAEAENVRKRVRRDMDDELKYATLPLIREIIPVLDNLERATQVNDEEAKSGVVMGVKMVIAQLNTVLQQFGCVKIEALGQPFDPDIHQALAQEPSAEVAPGTVIRAMLSGYKLHDRVVRPAQVFVAKAP